MEVAWGNSGEKRGIPTGDELKVLKGRSRLSSLTRQRSPLLLSSFASLASQILANPRASLKLIFMQNWQENPGVFNNKYSEVFLVMIYNKARGRH